MGTGRIPKIRRDGWTAERQLRFLDALAITSCVARAAGSAGMNRESAYRLRGRNALFAAFWDRALEGRSPSRSKGHEVEGRVPRPAPKKRANPPKVTKWTKWTDPRFHPFREQLCDLLSAEEQRPDHHTDSDHADGPDHRPDHRDAGGVERQIDRPRAKPDPSA